MKNTELLKIVVLSVLLALFAKEACSENVKPKPYTPIWITISPLNKDIDILDIQPNSVVDFIVVAGTFVDFMDIIVTVTATGGADIIGGIQKWSGTIKRNSAKTMTITVRTSKIGNGKITARAEPTAGKGVSFRAEAIYELGKSSGKNPPTGSKVKDRRGRDIIEYEVK